THKSARPCESGLLDDCSPQILRCAQDDSAGLCHPERSEGSVWITNIVTRAESGHRSPPYGVVKGEERKRRSCQERKRCWARACWSIWARNCSKESACPSRPRNGSDFTRRSWRKTCRQQSLASRCTLTRWPASARET